MSWATRMRTAVDVARGLSFLHGLNANVIYRDLKASNILLDSVCSKILDLNFICIRLKALCLNVKYHEYETVNWLNLFRNSMQSFQILALQGMALAEIELMFQRGL